MVFLRAPKVSVLVIDASYYPTFTSVEHLRRSSNIPKVCFYSKTYAGTHMQSVILITANQQKD